MKGKGLCSRERAGEKVGGTQEQTVPGLIRTQRTLGVGAQVDGRGGWRKGWAFPSSHSSNPQLPPLATSG